mmetsp:Transcript_26033/g.67282  ORF Transcript_26033/g.67282 Transcript_26033/m.67282 type:complete len:141 (-) Transcript_26033:303-725(-)
MLDMATIHSAAAQADMEKPKRPHPRGRRGGRSARAARKPGEMLHHHLPHSVMPLAPWPQPVLAVPNTTSAWTSVHAAAHGPPAPAPLLVFLSKPPPPLGPPPRSRRGELPTAAPLPERMDSNSSAVVPTLCALSVLAGSD